MVEKKTAGKTRAKARTKAKPEPAVPYAKSRHPDDAARVTQPESEPHAAGGHPGLGAGASN